MKRLLPLLAALLSIAVNPSAAKNKYITGEHTYTIRHGGETRSFVLYLPENIKPGAPLVIVLHGYGSSATPDKYPFRHVADREGFAVCYPQGEKDGRGKACWNVGYPFQAGLKRNDTAFLTFLAHHLQKSCNLSKTGTFATGMSNGGEMCYQLAFLRPKVFAAVAPVAGLTMEWLYRTRRPGTAIPLMEIHGTEDHTSEWNGDATGKGGWGEYIAVPMAVGLWAATNRCTHEIRQTKEPISDTGHKIIIHRYTGGPDGKDAVLYEIVGGGHSWAGKDIDTAQEIWDFFKRYLR